MHGRFATTSLAARYAEHCCHSFAGSERKTESIPRRWNSWRLSPPTKSTRDFERKFEQYGIDSGFLSIPADDWQQCSAYLAAKEIVANLPCTNDAAERVLRLATNVSYKTTPKSETELQAVYKVIKGTREKLHELATSSEFVTKLSLGAVNYNW